MRTTLSCLGLALVLLCPAKVHAQMADSVVSLDGTNWVLAADPTNVGVKQQWCKAPQPGARPARVPGIIQEVLGEYHGVAWYWHTVRIPAPPQKDVRYILRFWSVDYYADVWVNGQKAGSNEGADTMVEFDVTGSVKSGAENLLAVRVINPGNEPVDSFAIRECPGRNKFDPWGPGSSYNGGGITDSVELMLAPVVRIESLYLKPNWQTGAIEARVNVRNAGRQTVKAALGLTVAPASSGETLADSTTPTEFKPGDTLVKAMVQLREFQLWSPEEPSLYRVTARLNTGHNATMDEKSARCGFRDFRFSNGYFRLNGKRIFLKSAHFGGDVPMTGMAPFDESFVRKDFLSLKMMGFNMARCISGLGRRHVMDLADEIGLMVYDESYAAWCVSPSPHLAERWNQTTAGMIKRDRNHPSVVMWGLLNETLEGPVFRHAVDSLPFVRQLDDTRLVMLNSGRFDGMLFGDAGAILPRAWVTGKAFGAPFLAQNHTDKDLNHDGTVYPPGALTMHVGTQGEPAVLRFVAPSDGEYRLTAHFKGISGPPASGPITTGAASLIAAGKKIFSDRINCDGRPNETHYEGRINLRKGDCVDTLAESGNATFNSDTILVGLVVTDPAGVTHDATKDLSFEISRKTPWTYGYMPAGTTDPAKFIAFSGVFDGIRRSIGSLSNPGSTAWEDVLADKHPYQPCPHTSDVIKTLRTIDGAGRPLFISEYGFGSANHLLHLLGHYSQAQKGYAFDRQLLDDSFRRFSEDWARWNLAGIFGNIENYFRQCVAMEADGRLIGTSAIRANTNLVAHSLTACHDTVMASEGLITSFREPKHGVSDAMNDAWSPLRFCVFAEPVQAVRGGSVQIDAVLVNEDVLKPGKYPVRVQILGPDGSRPLDESFEVEIAPTVQGSEPPYAKPVFSRSVKLDTPGGACKLFVFFESGAAAEGGEYTFWLNDPVTLPRVASTVTLWGKDDELARWLESNGIKTRQFPAVPVERELILVGSAAGDNVDDLAHRIQAGATAIFLSPEAFLEANRRKGNAPLLEKVEMVSSRDWLYQNNDWAKNHPIFKGLPTGLLNFQYYREILGDKFYSGQAQPDEAVAGMINTALGYNSGLTVAVFRIGNGKVVLNSLLIRENLSGNTFHPVAERLLRNMLNFQR